MSKHDPLNLGGLEKKEQERIADLNRVLLEWTTLTNTPNKTEEQFARQQELTRELASSGVLNDNTLLDKILEGTAFDPKKVRDLLLGSIDPSQIDPGTILSGALNTSTNRNVNVRSNVVSTTNRTETRYVDLPTPEEFLDDFDSALNGYVEGLVQTGGLRSEVAQFALQNRNLIFGQYMRKQIENLLAGQAPFRVVGLDADEKLIGARAGDFARDQRATQGTEQRSESEQASSVPSETPLGQAIESAQSLNQTTTEQRAEDTTLKSTEAIVQRNKLGVVASLSPLDFLKDKATTQFLNQLYAGQKGSAQRQAQTAIGRDFGGAARRI